MLKKLKLLERLDLPDDFWERFNAQNKKLNKQVDSYEIENINNANLLTTAINPRVFWKYKDFSVNKKHKGVNRNTQGMNFEAYSDRLALLHKYCFDHNPKKV